MEFEESNHTIKLKDVPSGHPLLNYNDGGTLDVKKIFQKFLEHVHKAVSDLSHDQKKMSELGIDSLTVIWTPCKGK